eukprot:529744_1
MSSSWNELGEHPFAEFGSWYRNLKIIKIGDSWWRCGSSNMKEYCIKTNEIQQYVKYPENIQFKVRGHTLCEYNNIIYIVSNYGIIISFNPSNKQFNQMLNIPKIGRDACCILIKDQIHIFNGSKNN